MTDPTRLAAQAQAIPMAEEEIDLHEYLDTVIDNRWLILAVTLFIAAAAGLYAFTATPIYQADALIQVEQKKSPLGGLEGLDALMAGEAPTEAEIEIIRSRSLLTKVVRELKLDINAWPHRFPLIGDVIARHYGGEGPAGPWLGLDGYAWGGEKIRIDRLDVPPSLEGRALRLLAKGQGRFELLDDAGNTLLEGGVGKAAENDGVSIFVSQLVARPGTPFDVMKMASVDVARSLQERVQVSEKGRRTGILQLVYQDPDPARAKAVVDAIARTYLRQNVERKSEEAQQALAFLEQQLPKVKEQMQIAEEKLNDYRLRRGSVDLSLEVQALLDQTTGLEQQISELQMKYAEMRRRFTEAHPLVQALTDKIARLKREKQRFERKIKQLPETEQEILRLTREVKVNTELYTFLLNKVQELKVVKAGTVGNVRVLDYAVLPKYPVKPRKARILLLGMILGLFIGVLLAFLRKSLQKGVESPEIIEQKLGIPVYASVPHAEKQQELHEKMRAARGKGGDFLLARVADTDMAVESLRSLRTNLHFGLMDAKNNIVMISGPAPNVGKSFVSANLAHVLAAAGKPVLLIDADMRKGHLHEYFGIERTPGLSECICGDARLADAIHRDVTPNLDVLTTGNLPPNPAELLMSEHFEQLLNEVSQRYELVLIDTPPVLAVTDAVVIGKLAGTAFLLIRAGRHPIQEIQQAVRHLEHGGVKLQGIVFNDVQPRRSRYGYGYGYGYGTYQYEYKRK